MKKNKVLYFVLAGLLANTASVSAQVGIGTNNPETSSVLELKSTKRGILIPRIDLTSRNVAAPVTAPVNSLMVYNKATAGSGVNAVTPGYYYWDASASLWMRVMNQADVQSMITTSTVAEVDGIVGNEVLNATTGKGLVRAGSGTNADPYTLGLANGSADGQVMKWDNAAGTWAPGTDANTTYSGSTSVVLNGSSFERAALSGDVTASQNSNTVTVTKIQGKAISATAPTSNGQVLAWNGSAWAPTAPGIATEVDGIVGNEVVNATANKGLVRAGSGTNADPYTLGLANGSADGQVMKWDNAAGTWAPGTDANTQSRETVSAGTNISVTATGGTDNKNFQVSIAPATTAGKILTTIETAPGSGQFTTAWADAPSGGGTSGVLGNGQIKSVAQITTGEWASNQFALIQNTVAAIQLPAPEANRIIAIHNDTGQPLNYASPAPNRNSSIQPGKGQLLMSDGVKWYVIGGL